MTSSAVGTLELILGPMYSGKTNLLIDIYNIHNKMSNVNIVVINYDEDTRYHDKKLCSHDGNMIDCIMMHELKDVFHTEPYKTSSVILINEGQFFNDLEDCVLQMVEQDQKHIYVAALSGDFMRRPFANISRLISLADRVNVLHSKCNMCGKDAIFSKRLTNETQVKVIGSSNYIPVCRACFIKR
jgi:thymidine kinase